MAWNRFAKRTNTVNIILYIHLFVRRIDFSYKQISIFDVEVLYFERTRINDRIPTNTFSRKISFLY